MIFPFVAIHEELDSFQQLLFAVSQKRHSFERGFEKAVDAITVWNLGMYNEFKSYKSKAIRILCPQSKI